MQDAHPVREIDIAFTINSFHLRINPENIQNITADILDASTYHFACEKGGVVANAMKLNHPGKNCLHWAELWARGSPVG